MRWRLTFGRLTFGLIALSCLAAGIATPVSAGVEPKHGDPTVTGTTNDTGGEVVISGGDQANSGTNTNKVEISTISCENVTSPDGLPDAIDVQPGDTYPAWPGTSPTPAPTATSASPPPTNPITVEQLATRIRLPN